MYYEEKIIDGVLCYRCDPQGEFMRYTVQGLTEKLQSLCNRFLEMANELDYLKA